MTEWNPEPGDDAYHVVSVAVQAGAYVPTVSDAGDLESRPAIDSTIHVSLRVPVLDVSGGRATIEQFGQRFAVLVEELHEEPLHDDCVYPAHAGSPYPSLEAVVDEIKRELE